MGGKNRNVQFLWLLFILSGIKAQKPTTLPAGGLRYLSTNHATNRRRNMNRYKSSNGGLDFLLAEQRLGLTRESRAAVRSLIRRSQQDVDNPAGNQEQLPKDEVENSIGDLWTWSINGAKIAASLAILTGSIKVIQALMGYWRDQVLTWWARLRQRWNDF
jgi:hypothetical protein